MQGSKLLAHELECGLMSSNLYESQAAEITVAYGEELHCKVELLERRCKLLQVCGHHKSGLTKKDRRDKTTSF